MNVGVAQITGVVLQFFIGKKCPLISLSDTGFNF